MTVLSFDANEDQLEWVTPMKLLEAMAEEVNTFQKLCRDLICK